MSKDALTVEQLIEQLGRYPKAAQMLVIFEPKIPIIYRVTGVMAPAEYDIAHLFNEDAQPPDEGRVYLTVEFQHDKL